MKIKTTFIISTALFGAILLIIAASAVITSRQVEQTNRQEAIARNLAHEANELSYLSSAYLLYHESQQLDRWQSKYDSFSSDLANVSPGTPEQRALVDNIRSNQQRLQAVFAEVRSTIEGTSQTRTNVADPAFIQVSWSRMEVQNQGMIFDASRLEQMLHDQEDHLKQTNNWIIVGLVGVFGAFLLTNYFLTYRRTLKSISEFQSGTKIIGSGNLDFAIAVKGNDEIGELSRAFNQMTANLKEVTASKADLVREIDERKKAEEALRESEENYRRIVETATEGIWLAQPDGKTIFVNQRMAEMLGYSREEMLTKLGIEFLDQDEKEAVPETRAQLQEGARIEREFKFRRKDGTVLWTIVSASPLLDQSGRHIGNLSMHTDITERKLAEQKLAEQATILANINDAVVAYDMDFHITYWNQAAEKVYGFTADEAMEKTTYELLRPTYTDITREEMISQLMSAGHVEFESLRRSKDDRELNIETHSILLRDDNGTPARFVSVVRDITARKREEQERETLLAEVQRRSVELDAANKELESFSYSVSHDLRAPLRHIDGFSKILLQDYADKLDEQGKEYLQFVGEGSRKMGELIDAMLRLSRVSRTEMHRQPVNLGEIAQSILSELHSEQPERQVHFSIAPKMITTGDPQLLRILLENLLSNAWKFTSKSQVTEIEFGLSYRDSKGVYHVKDNGAGFDMAYADKLFGAFQRLHGTEEFPGTGIGLATVQRIIHRHGGKIWAEGAVDKGATFYFTIES